MTCGQEMKGVTCNMITISFLKLHLICKVNIQIKIFLIIGNLYSTGLLTGVSNMKNE